MSSSGIVLIKNPETDCIGCPLACVSGGRSLMKAKLAFGKKVYGILSASISPEYVESNEEQELYGEIADDIAFALYNLEQEQKRKQTVEKLKIAKIEAEKSSKKAQVADSAKSEFLANMSHEIRTPMNAIMGFSEILREQLNDPKYIKYVDTILSSGKTLLGLINDILDLSKVEAGKMEFQYRPIDPHALFGDIVRIFSVKIKNKGLKLITDIDDKLPRSLLLDEVRMRQILFNLVGNAVKFTDEGYIELKVKGVFYSDRSKIDLMFSVKDTGIGISEEDKKVVFDAFQQSKGQSTKKYGGTGLGLAITKKLVELMNGEISVDSIMGKGSIFKIIIKEVSVATVGPDIEERKSEYENISFYNQKVLVVDDIESNRLLLNEVLSLYRLHVLEAENGKEAINIAQNQNPDIILMDLRMPVMDGYEAIKILKGDSKLKSIPVIVLTASAMKSSEEDIKKINCEGYIRKPISRPELFAELKKYLDFTSTSEEEKVSDGKKKKEDFRGKTDMKVKEKLPEIINKLENEIFIKYSKIKKEFIINDIEDFAKEMQVFGKEYNLNLVTDWGKKLSEQSGNFDIENLQDSLNGFVDILNKIKNFQEE
jgi:signal transduction histidine kinase/CheY-like chemotaxis protein